LRWGWLAWHSFVVSERHPSTDRSEIPFRIVGATTSPPSFYRLSPGVVANVPRIALRTAMWEFRLPVVSYRLSAQYFRDSTGVRRASREKRSWAQARADGQRVRSPHGRPGIEKTTRLLCYNERAIKNDWGSRATSGVTTMLHTCATTSITGERMGKPQW